MAFKPEVAPPTASATTVANNLFLNVILTFDKNKPQSFVDIKDLKTVLNILSSKDAALDHFNKTYHSDDAPLVKVSMCLQYCEDEWFDMLGSAWYKESNGKLWMDEFKSFRNEVDFVNGDMEMESMSITWEESSGAFIDFEIEIDGKSFSGSLFAGGDITELYAGNDIIQLKDASRRVTEFVEQVASDHIQCTTVY